jgi:hypothetical protein
MTASVGRMLNTLAARIVTIANALTKLFRHNRAPTMNAGRADRARLARIADRALMLLEDESQAQQQAEMLWAERMLFEANLLGFDPPRSSPQAWTDQAIGQNLDLIDSFLWLQQRDIFPEYAETFEELIYDLVPKEGGL